MIIYNLDNVRINKYKYYGRLDNIVSTKFQK